MARVNNKLLVIVSLATIVTGGVVGGVYMLNYRNDPMRHIRNGDAAMQAGEYRKAADYYGRAIGKRPNSLEFHNKYIEASTRVVPQSSAEARERYQFYVSSLLKRAQIARDNEDLWRRALEEVRQQAEMTDNPNAWQMLHDRVENEMVKSLARDDKMLPLAQLYSSYAQARRADGLTPDEVKATVAVLEPLATELQGADLDLIYGGLLDVRLKQAGKLDGRQAVDAWKTYDELLEKAKAAVPDGTLVARCEIDRLRTRRDAGDASVTDQMLAAVADRTSASALQHDEPLRTYQAVRAIVATGLPDGLSRATALLRAYVAKHPDASLHRGTLAYCLRANGELDEAEKESRAVLDAAPLPVGLESASQSELRVTAAQQLFDVEFSRLGRVDASDQAKRAEAMERLSKARDKIVELNKGFTDDSVVLKADGKLAYANADFLTASMKFSELIKRGTIIDRELFILASLAAQQLKQTGQALDYTIRGLALEPNNIDLLERKMALQSTLGRHADAVATATLVLSKDPTRKGAQEVVQAGAQAGQVDEHDPVVQGIKKASDEADRRDFPAAKVTLEELLTRFPRDTRVYYSLAMVCDALGDSESARKYLEEGLVVNPGEPNLRRIAPFISSKVPSERVIKLVEQNYANPNDRIAWTYVRLATLADQTEDNLPQLESSNKAEFDRQSKEVLPNLRKAEEEWKQKAMASVPGHPAILDLTFTRALAKKDLATAQQIAAEAERGSDPALPWMLRARLAVNQGKFGEAITVLRQAIDRNIETADAYRLMGFAQEQSGQLADALKSYAEGYKRDPVNMNNARAYISALVKSGERQQALVVLREARFVAGDDIEIGELWLGLEYEIGDRRTARQMRESRQRLMPSDRRNATALATMLGEMSPTRADINDETGKEKYNDAQWRTLDEAMKEREISAERGSWRKKSDKIFADLMKSDPTSSELALVRAATYRHQGKLAEAEAVMTKMIADAGDKADATMFVALGINYGETNEGNKANAAFAEAVKRQDDSRREADAAIAEYYFQRGSWEKAVESYERVAEKVHDRALMLRIAETYGRVKNYDKARARLAQAAAISHDVVIDQLDASLAEGQGDDLRARATEAEKKGDATGAKTALAGAMKCYADAREALARARAVVASNPGIAVQEASVYMKEYEATKEKKTLALALECADRATKLRADYWPAALAKSDILVASGDRSAAIAELERFVKAAPSVVDGRKKLVLLLAGTGNMARASDYVREAISFSPNDPQWHLMLGEVEAANGNIDQAVLSYERADRVKPDLATLNRLTELRLLKSPPDWEATRKSLREREAEVKRAPYLQSAIGVMLYNTGEQKAGLDALRNSYKLARSYIADGSARIAIMDKWYANLRFIYPPARASEAEQFISELTENKLEVYDLRWLAELWFASGLPDGNSHAIELGRKAIALDTKEAREVSARLHDLVGSATFLQGDCKGALEEFGYAKDILPDEPAVLNNYAYLCGECGDPAKGVEAAEKASSLASGVAEYLDTLGFVLGKAGNNKRAIDKLNEAIKIAPSVSAHIHLAQILQAEGRKDEAKAHLRAAGDLKPDANQQKQINQLIEQLR